MPTAAASPTASAFVGSIPELYDRHLVPVIFEPYAQVVAAMLAPAREPGASCRSRVKEI